MTVPADASAQPDARFSVRGRPEKLTWQLARVVLARSPDQAFLDHAWLTVALRVLPPGSRRAACLRVLSLSPHYFGLQWKPIYAGRTRAEVLEGEFERNRVSRDAICDQLVRPHLRPDMTVLDFGCGAGFLARSISPHVARVVAVDISRGVIACARELNPAPNLAYLANRSSGLDLVGDDSVDVACSFAVFQHLDRDEALGWLRELVRKLKPGGTGLCHFAVGAADAGVEVNGAPAWVRNYRLRFTHYREDELGAMLRAAAGPDVEIVPISQRATIADDIGTQHLAVFRKPAQ